MPRPRIHLEEVTQLPLTYEATIPEDYLDLMGHMNVMCPRFPLLFFYP